MVASSSGTDSGWVAGAGLEWAFAQQWSAKIEYLHYQFDNIGRDFSYTGFPAATRHIDRKDTDETVRVGVNYRFKY
jgi:outer membrane immunogenic protein